MTFQPKKALGMPCGVRLHTLLCIIAEEAENEIHKLTKEQMQALLKAYHASDADVQPSLMRSIVPKSDLLAALLSTLRNPASKLLRYNPADFK